MKRWDIYSALLRETQAFEGKAPNSNDRCQGRLKTDSHNTAVDTSVIDSSRLDGEKVCSKLAILMFFFCVFHHCALEEERPSPPTNIFSCWCHLKIPADSITLQLLHTPAHQP